MHQSNAATDPRLTAEDRRRVAEVLAATADDIETEARPDDVISIGLGLVPPPQHLPPDRTLCALSVEIYGETDQPDDYAVLGDWQREIEVPVIDWDEAADEAQACGAMAVIWREMVLPWLAD